MYRSIEMDDKTSSRNKYILTFALGTIVGGIGLALATKAMPKMMSRMMQNMMAQMGKEGCDPQEM
jgi:hypothetical protein